MNRGWRPEGHLAKIAQILQEKVSPFGGHVEQSDQNCRILEKSFVFCVYMPVDSATSVYTEIYLMSSFSA